MNKSEQIENISLALLKAQSEMDNAKKGSTNPFFKSKYADLNSVREAVMPLLNVNGITVLQPHVIVDGINYVETLLLHSSGEWLSGYTQIVFGKTNDAQAQGSGITYARRYGLASLLSIGAEDDDANLATVKEDKKPQITDEQFAKAKGFVVDKKTYDSVCSKYFLTSRQDELLFNQIKN
jgi:hypothetical protein